MHGFSTKAIHAGQEPDPTTGAVIPPIHPSSTYAQDGVGGTRSGYEYSRSANPTRTTLQECLAALEGGRHAVAFGSGMGATDVLLRALMRPGDHIVIPHDAYGGTFRLVDKVLGPWGITHTPVDLADTTALRAALRPETRVIWCETPTNPLLGIADIAAVADVAREAAGAARRRQHVRLALPAGAAHAGRRRRAALHHQVHRRALRRRRRRVDHLRRRARRATALHPERRGLGAQPVRRLAHPARRQDAGRAHGTAQRQRRTGGGVPGRAPRGRAGVLPGPPRAPGPRGRGQADAAVRRDGVDPAGRGPRRGTAGVRGHRGCSRWPSRSAGSSRSSSTPGR